MPRAPRTLQPGFCYIERPKNNPLPARPEVIEGEVTLELPAEPEATSPDARQQTSDSEITVGVPPEQEAPATRRRRPSSMLVVATGLVCLAILLAHLFLPTFLAPPATVTIIPLSRALVTVTTLSLQGRPLGPLTLAQTAMVPATGHRHLDTERARGAITFFNGLLTAQTIAAGTVLTNSSGVQVATERAAFIPAGNPPVYGRPPSRHTRSCQGRRAISARATSTRSAALPRSWQQTWPPSPAGRTPAMRRWSPGPISTSQRPL